MSKFFSCLVCALLIFVGLLSIENVSASEQKKLMEFCHIQARDIAPIYYAKESGVGLNEIMERLLENDRFMDQSDDFKDFVVKHITRGYKYGISYKDVYANVFADCYGMF